MLRPPVGKLLFAVMCPDNSRCPWGRCKHGKKKTIETTIITCKFLSVMMPKISMRVDMKNIPETSQPPFVGKHGRSFKGREKRGKM